MRTLWNAASRSYSHMPARRPHPAPRAARMTSTATGSAAIAVSAAARVRWENSVSVVGVLRLGPAGGPVVGFVPRAEENVMPVGNGRRVAVVAGCRTPFCRAGTALKDVRAVDLARGVARELIERTNLDGAAVNAVIFGQAAASPPFPNLPR